MRILAIRGSELASLGPGFTIDFTQEPLASSGLFAISGPTGAGKSTLLDALCLALYDCTPRLARAGGRGAGLPDVRDETISAQDPRNLLRRGAHEGCAEVDFVGNDNLPYRSRWTVRRARSRADGKLQASEMQLLRLTDRQLIGSNKTEVLSEIRTRLGLSFEQFTRAVLLAQNEFASFLKADDNERAELLETLTGTDTFTGISRRAFDRSKLEQEVLKLLRAQLADQQPLNGPARAELESAKISAEQVFAGVEHSRAEAEAGLRWHGELAKAREAERIATETAERASDAAQQAEARRALLYAVEAVQEARPLLSERDRAGLAYAESVEALTRADQMLAAATQSQTISAAELEEAQIRSRTAAGRHAAAKPDLDRARWLDAEIAQFALRRAEAEGAQTAAEQDAQQARQSLSMKQDERAEAGAAHTETVAWIDENAGMESLAIDWPRWHTLLEQAQTLRRDAQAAETEFGQHKRRIDEARRAHAEAAERLAAAQNQCGDAERRYARTVEAVSKFDVPALNQGKRAAEAERESLVRGEQIWREFLEIRQRSGQVEQSAAALAQMIEDGGARLDALEAALPAAQSALDQAERSLRAAELACADSVAELRMGLTADTPCPVCGSKTHPWVDHQTPLDTLLNSLRSETNRCREVLLALRSDASSFRTMTQTRRAQLRELEKERPGMETALRNADRRWQEWPRAAEIGTVQEAERLTWFTARQSALQAALEALLSEERGWHAALEARDTARARLETTRAQLHAAEQQEAAAAATAERADLGIKTAQAAQLESEKRLEVLLADLVPAFPALPDWRQDWFADPDGFKRRFGEQAAHYRREQGRVIELKSHVERLSVEIASMQKTADKAAADLATRRAEFQRFDNQWKAAADQRRQLFDGRPAETVEAELQAAVDAAAADLEHKSAGAQKAEQSLAHAIATRDAAERQRLAAKQADKAAATALSHWMSAVGSDRPDLLGLDLPRLRELLGHDGAWAAAERTALTALDASVQRELAVLGERRQAREGIERQRPTDQSAAILEARLESATDAVASQRKRLAELEVKLLQDDERRRKSEELAAGLADKEAEARIWAQLNELIGSADGKKFRNFAQQLTLDVLLAYANRHLADLSRRYRLERIPDTLGLMVVDQDMGDEIRSVHSLSGGETFLVSLGLALGLASLSSNRVRVESLFVDEGFGSLDAETLAAAMDALDCLQSQGRKVGVISHVREMTERIGTQIQVRRLAGGQSRVEIVG